MNRQRKMAIIMNRLGKDFRLVKWWEKCDYTPFQTMVAIILSQRTSWKNVKLAMSVFSTKYQGPFDVYKVSVGEIEEAIRASGNYRAKAKAVKGVASLLVEKFGGNIESFLARQSQKVRDDLMRIKGIGYKTTDVMLLALIAESIFPVDAHITRVLNRLGIVQSTEYERIKRVAEELIPSELRMNMHLLLISFGREFCRANHPRCSSCKLNDLCNFFFIHRTNEKNTS